MSKEIREEIKNLIWSIIRVFIFGSAMIGLWISLGAIVINCNLSNFVNSIIGLVMLIVIPAITGAGMSKIA